MNAQKALADKCEKIIEKHVTIPVIRNSASTDCNIPLSMGIPAICVGCCRFSGAHTREEYVEISSLKPGLFVAYELILHHF